MMHQHKTNKEYQRQLKVVNNERHELTLPLNFLSTSIVMNEEHVPEVMGSAHLI